MKVAVSAIAEQIVANWSAATDEVKNTEKSPHAPTCSSRHHKACNFTDQAGGRNSPRVRPSAGGLFPPPPRPTAGSLRSRVANESRGHRHSAREVGHNFNLGGQTVPRTWEVSRLFDLRRSPGSLALRPVLALGGVTRAFPGTLVRALSAQAGSSNGDLPGFR
jgi:hypothetical protein